MSPTPLEREITKQQLWERNEAHYNAYQALLKEISNSIDGITDVVIKQVNGAIKNNMVEWGISRMNSNEQFQSSKKELEKIVNDSVTRMQKVLDVYTKDIDKKLSQFNILIEDKTRKQVSDGINQLSVDAKNIFNAVKDYKDSTDLQIHKFQRDIGDKIGLVDTKFNSIIKKFKVISNEIS